MTSDPLRVCHLVSDDGWGGAEALVAGLVDAQDRQPEIELQLVALNDGRLAAMARRMGIPVHVTPESGRSPLTLLRDLRQTLSALQPHIVHSHRYKENALSYWLGPRLGFRCVVTLHGIEPPESASARFRIWLGRRIANALASHAGARFASVSEDLRDILKIDVQRCEIIPNGVVVPAVPIEVGGQSDPRIIGWVGRMVPVKDLRLLVEAFACLPSELAVRLLLVGDGPERPAVQQWIHDLGLADRVELTGFCDDPEIQYRRMSLLALTSTHEGLPMCLLEAMALGLPCVSAAVGGIPAALGESFVRLIKERNPAAWAAGLAEVLTQPKLARDLSERGRSRVIEAFSTEHCAKSYLDLYLDARSD